jgi:predicted RNA-binding Zn-ribbon protein involved in translation (DUF1610 family)
MNTEGELERFAKAIAVALERQASSLLSQLEELEAQKRKLQMQLDTTRRAVKRAGYFQSRIGSEFQCPSCWVKNVTRTALTSVAGTHGNFFVCKACGSDYTISDEM